LEEIHAPFCLSGEKAVILLKIEEIQQAKLVELGWRYGQFYCGGYVAGQMIMSVFMNRVKCGWGNHLDVMTKVLPFAAENELPPLIYPGVWDGNFVKLLHVVTGVFDGSIADMSKGSLYFADLNKIERPWFQEKIVDPIKEDGPTAGQRQHPIVANINSLSFFR
jgi:hypothetical protein